MEFQSFQKIPRLSRDVVVTEKIDGTNAQIYIPHPEDNIDGMISVHPDIQIFAGSRNKWITPTPADDNMGFAEWVKENAQELIKLGAGRHYGEWWGRKIQRGYGLQEKRFSLFNTSMWTCDWNLNIWSGETSTVCKEVSVCHVVPVIYTGIFNTEVINLALQRLQETGSIAAPGFKDPEGIVIYHIAGNLYFKKTIKNDESPKGKK